MRILVVLFSCFCYCFMFFFFFFQAEDGIRDDLVTGVQTCALPICPCVDLVEETASSRACSPNTDLIAFVSATSPSLVDVRFRSEERRVGKECRSRWWPDD